MFLRRVILPITLVAGLAILFSLAVAQNRRLSWQTIPRIIGLGEKYGPTEEQITSGNNILPDLRTNYSRLTFMEPKIENMSPYPIGELKPVGSTYTKCLVIAKQKKENTTWVDEELGDLMEQGTLETKIYTVDDRKAELKPPKNKGHEVMVYLTYIIDHYEDLPDLSIFMHAHRFAWHNNELLDRDAAQTVRLLSPERVTREGYMNLRCHWDPGCPDWLHPGRTVRNDEKKEEVLIAESWSQLFPLEPIPTVLAQPCCAQFAVSRERIWKTPKMRYIFLRDWLLRTKLSDYLSGRVFEYVWQYIFSKAPIHCPSMSACYCDGYGLCFGSAEDFDHWFELRYHRNEYKEELRLWQEKAGLVDEWQQLARDGKMVDLNMLEVPEPGKDRELVAKIKELDEVLEASKVKALARGNDPKNRAAESNRKWKQGDGF